MQIAERDADDLVKMMRLSRREKDADQKGRSLCAARMCSASSNASSA